MRELLAISLELLAKRKEFEGDRGREGNWDQITPCFRISG